MGRKLLAIAAPMVQSSAKIATPNTMKATRRPRVRPSMKSGRSSRFRRVTGLARGWTTELGATGCANTGRGAGAGAAAAAAQNGVASGPAVASGTLNGLVSGAAVASGALNGFVSGAAIAGGALNGFVSGTAASANAGPSGGGMARAGRAAGGKGGGPAGFGAAAGRNGGGPGGRARTDETESSGARGAFNRTGSGVAKRREGWLIEPQKITRLQRPSARSTARAKSKCEHVRTCRAAIAAIAQLAKPGFDLSFRLAVAGCTNAQHSLPICSALW